jgi:NADH-quinone oxidoreductase subunit L
VHQVLTPHAGSVVQLAWLIPLIPAISAGLLLLFGKRLGKAAAPVAIAAIGASFVLSLLVFGALRAQPEDARTFVVHVADWLQIGPLTVAWDLLVDPLSSVMLLLVTGVGTLIHLYSVGYMHGDERYPRFFAYLNLFAASMLILVLGENLLVLFVGWELVGLCSYLLIGFWFERRDYASAAKKAFVTNRVGDVGFMIAMFLVFGAVGSLSFSEVLPATGTLAAGTATAVGLLLLLGATGKSAQIPLYVWLPDAMAGPTPVSALIHAATMVTAGVYLIARMSPLFSTVPDVGMVVAWIGALTALVAALIACVQRDLKKILAYSTVSQLGYMFIAVGVGAYTAGVFHLLTHGFFKALLFLAAGSVMHALHDQTDVWAMGGLRRHMPITFGTSLVAVLAISGIPPLSGYFSKEEILAAASEAPGAMPIYVIGLVVAALTAFYMTRWFVLIFLGKPRFGDEVHPHESPWTMSAPLVVLALLSAGGGLLNVSAEDGWLHHWLAETVTGFHGEHTLSHATLIALAMAAAIGGIAAAVVLYRRVTPEPLPRFAGYHRLAFDRFRVDELYQLVIARPGRMLADALAWFDRRGIDGAVNGAASATAALATVGRRTQTGYVRSYALGTLVGALLIAVLFLLGSWGATA